MLGKMSLIRVGTILRPAIRMMNAPFGRLSQSNGPDRQISLHPVANGPTDDAARVQVKDDGQIKPALTGPDVADVSGPLLIGAIR